MSDSELSFRDRIVGTACVFAWLFGGAWLVDAETWGTKLGALALITVPGWILVSIVNKYRKPNFDLILDHPLREMRKKEMAEVKARWKKANDRSTKD